MSMFLAILIFVVGLALIVKGGDAFVDAATWIAKVSGIPTFIVGATIVSLATTLPEMLVSAMAAAKGSVDMACGNAIGSVTANTGMILAIAVLAMPTVIKRSDYLAKGLILLACVSTLLLFGYTGQLKWMGSVVLIVLFVIFIVDNVLSAKSSMENAPAEEKPEHDKKTVITNVVKFILGAAATVLGARLMVDSATDIANFLHVPEAVIAVTIVAIGTSLPELVTTITAIAKKEASLSAGNVIGANIIDTSLILPICSLISGKELPLSNQCITLDIPFCLAIAVIMVVPMLMKKKFMRWQGVAALCTYAAYMIMVTVL